MKALTVTPFISYLLLLIFTVLSSAIGEMYFHASMSSLNPILVAGVVMVLVILKGQQIVGIFMELKHAPAMWRRIMYSYIVLIPTLLFLIYWLM